MCKKERKTTKRYKGTTRANLALMNMLMLDLLLFLFR